MRRWIFFMFLLTGFGTNTEACRFTVREIGFSTLSHDIYSLVIIDKEADAADLKWDRFHGTLEDSNIRLLILDPETDTGHPYLKEHIAGRLSLPAYLLIAPDRRMLELDTGTLSEIVDQAYISAIRKSLMNELTNVFSVVLWIEGRDEVKNKEAERIIKRDLKQIESIIPYMPKEVKNGPVSIRISSDEFHREKVLLWSLGIEKQPEEPVAFVLYGRGRIIGEAISALAITEGRLYKYMSMIGADCECGLDRKWMLGKQIPLLWSSENRQQLANELGFDVDNPMIMSEMSLILAKETNPDLAGDVGFGIETIDLDSAFDQIPEIRFDEVESVNNYKNLILIVSGLMLVILVSTGFFFLHRKRKM